MIYTIIIIIIIIIDISIWILSPCRRRVCGPSPYYRCLNKHSFPTIGSCIRGGFKGGGFNKYVIASCVCVATVLFAMLSQANYSTLKPPPVKQPPTQVTTRAVASCSPAAETAIWPAFLRSETSSRNKIQILHGYKSTINYKSRTDKLQILHILHGYGQFS